ncbi:MAG: PASTA domain-containing protein [Paenibacillus dendritiformis]|uniref:PASTA domain-containing protein n=1 Tax=uncultured Paenibacillus sp. TaxID=227322 RepID=UPI0025E24445|nr:PASTA domain-containing protein [uncultured Paenibacillus sp.]MDU5142810.1 PASTA domain-containing protein [Paenibacillus dendritiformis]
MSTYIAERYQLNSVIFHLGGGMLYEAVDMSLQRDVFIYVVENTDSGRAEEYRNAFGNVSHFSNNRFFHMLNAGMSGQDFYVVFMAYSGMPLVKYAQRHALGSEKVLSMIYELGTSIQEALEEGVSRFPVTIDNVWVTADNQLIIMNYWTQAEEGEHGTTALYRLLYQLCTLHPHVPSQFDVVETRLYGALKDLNDVQRDLVLKLMRKVHTGDASLFTFMVGLREILEQPDAPMQVSRDVATPVFTAAPPVQADPPRRVFDEPEPDEAEADEDLAEEEDDDEYERKEAASFNGSKMLLIVACVCVFFAVLGGAVIWANSLSKDNEPVAVTEPGQEAGSDGAAEQPGGSGGDADNGAVVPDGGDSGSVADPNTSVSSGGSSSSNGGSSSSNTDSSSSAGPGSQQPDTNTGTPTQPDTQQPGTTEPGTIPGDPGTTDPGTTTPGTGTPDTGTPADPANPGTETPPAEAGEPGEGEGKVPSLIGLTLEEAEEQVKAAGLRWQYFKENSEEQPAGQIFKQEPEAGAPIKKGDRVTFYISREQK